MAALVVAVIIAAVLVGGLWGGLWATRTRPLGTWDETARWERERAALAPRPHGRV